MFTAQRKPPSGDSSQPRDGCPCCAGVGNIDLDAGNRPDVARVFLDVATLDFPFIEHDIEAIDQRCSLRHESGGVFDQRGLDLCRALYVRLRILARLVGLQGFAFHLLDGLFYRGIGRGCNLVVRFLFLFLLPVNRRHLCIADFGDFFLQQHEPCPGFGLQLTFCQRFNAIGEHLDRYLHVRGGSGLDIGRAVFGIGRRWQGDQGNGRAQQPVADDSGLVHRIHSPGVFDQ